MISKRLFLAGLLFALHPSILLASEGSITAPGGIADGQFTWSLYAPDWIWQGQRVNILIVFNNHLPSTATVRAAIELPPPLPLDDRQGRNEAVSQSDTESVFLPYFAYDGPTSQSVAVGPGETRRMAFANILARDEFERPDGTRIRLTAGHDFPFRTELSAQSADGDGTATTSFTVRTIRGGAVPEGLWATWLPVGLILLWCALIFLIVPRMARPGAWREPSDPIETDGP